MYDQNNPAFQAFIRRKIDRIKSTTAYLKSLSVDVPHPELPNDEDLWYEYCEYISETRW